MTIEIQPVDAGDAEAQRLVAELDADLDRRYPGLPAHGIDAGEFRAAGGYFVLLRSGGEAVGCGAFRPVETGRAEIKRMFVREPCRGHGFAKLILRHLEGEARRRGFRGLVLETGVGQPEAIGLYQSSGYFPIPNYGSYAGNLNSRCFARRA